MSIMQNKTALDFQAILYRNEKFKPFPTTLDEIYVTIAYGNRRIPVGRSVFVERCPYFNAMMSSGLQEASTNELNIEGDINPTVFINVLKYIQTGEVTLTPGNLEDVYLIARYFLLADLMEKCRIILIQNINLEMLDYIQNFAKDQNFTATSEATLRFEAKKFESVWKSGLFRSWKVDFILDVLRSDRVVVSDEQKVLLFALEWLNSDYTNRAHNATALMRELRFTFLTQTKLNEAAITVSFNHQLIQLLYRVANDLSTKTTLPRIYHKGIYTITVDRNGDLKFERFWPADGSVTVLKPPSFTGAKDIKMVLHKESIYAVDCTSTARNDQFLIYNPIKDTWTSGASLNRENYSRTRICSFEEELYAFYNKGASTVGMVYCVKTDTWNPLPGDMPSKSNSCLLESVTTCGDSIYLLITIRVGFSFRYINMLLRYKPSTHEWSETPCQYYLDTFDVMEYKSKLLFIGRGTRAVKDVMILFSPEEKSFTKYYFKNRSDSRVAFFDDSFHILYGGSNDDSCCSESFDPDFMDGLIINHPHVDMSNAASIVTIE